MAGSHPRRHRGAGAERGAAVARKDPLGDRLSGLGHRTCRQQGGADGAGQIRQHRGEAVMMRLLGFIGGALTLALVQAAPAGAMTIEKIVSHKGVTAWLVREKAVPLVALNYAFKGGVVL